MINKKILTSSCFSLLLLDKAERIVEKAMNKHKACYKGCFKRFSLHNQNFLFGVFFISYFNFNENIHFLSL